MIELSKSSWKQVRDAYEHSDISMKDIAKKYHVKYGTLRVHKNRYKWQRDSQSNSSHHVTNKRNSVTNHVAPKISVTELQKSGLTDKQQAFCLRYLQCYNATKAYKYVYQCKLSTALTNGPALLRKTRIQKELTKIRQNNVNHLHFNRLDAIKRLIEMYYANPNDYVHFGHKTEVTDEGEKWQRPYLYFKNENDVDTSLVNGLKLGRNGADVELPDKFQIGKLLVKILANPVNHDIKNDTLVEAFIKGQKNTKNHKNKQ